MQGARRLHGDCAQRSKVLDGTNDTPTVRFDAAINECVENTAGLSTVSSRMVWSLRKGHRVSAARLRARISSVGVSVALRKLSCAQSTTFAQRDPPIQPSVDQ